MKAIATSDNGTLTAMVWAIFWRFALGYAVASNLILGGLSFAYASISVYQNLGAGMTDEEASAHIAAGIMPWWLNLLSSVLALVLAFFILRWVIRSLNGKNVGGKTFLLATMSNDKDFSNAN